MNNAYDFFPHGDSRHYWYGGNRVRNEEATEMDRQTKERYIALRFTEATKNRVERDSRAENGKQL